MRKVIIIGGGLAGLIAAICLRRHKIDVLLIEKKVYPFQRVCGEYISNEVRNFLEHLDIYPHRHVPSQINRLQLSSVNGKSAFLALQLGGFGISRFTFDHFLYEKAVETGVDFMLNTQVADVKFSQDLFTVATDSGETLQSTVVIGAFGKRSKLDKSLNRPFFKRKSPYLGVKYHVEYGSHAHDLIALHNFNNGYCGINKIEDGKYNLCYLSARSNLNNNRKISEMEQNVLCRNPELEKIFSSAKFLFDKPEVINEISFETKKPVEQHILMCGDAAGMITPLCGNGMAMGIHSAKILCEEIVPYLNSHNSRFLLEQNYVRRWNTLFKNRLWSGRQIQRLFGSELVSNFAVEVARRSKPISNFLVRQTHGKPF
ncbi:Putative alkylhalidase [Fulvivirga imtechensis AK7]|uniref:Putative alkylhalidase n=1 Tax=Fulvivirga imtechensis AK7 TaxID=1237149 RepID=L8JP34_9BACT|nr:NAD(P)/FAD-dependent oxidoreductase [Fulvivirga imtechensis]ELR70716.1 Putative alkylhalidase [Fulvivirga imtechensis AK7]